MTLPAKVVDRLFERLTATYGNQWLRMWNGIPVNDAKSAWAHELSGFGSNLESLAWALENLPESPPNVIQFRNLARLAPAAEVPRLTEPTQNPKRVAAALQSLKTLTNPERKHEKRDGLKWAKRIIERVAQGNPPSKVAVSMAREALTRNGFNPDDFLGTHRRETA